MLRVKEGNKIITYDEDANADYTKTETYISDKEIATYREMNQYLRETHKNPHLKFLGRIPVDLFDSVKQGIFEKMSAGNVEAQAYLLTKEGNKHLDDLTTHTIYSTTEFKKILGH